MANLKNRVQIYKHDFLDNKQILVRHCPMTDTAL